MKGRMKWKRRYNRRRYERVGVMRVALLPPHLHWYRHETFPSGTRFLPWGWTRCRCGMLHKEA